MASLKYESQVRPPLVEGTKNYHQITEDIVRPIETDPSKLWWIGFLTAVLLLCFGIFAITREVINGVGQWNLNKTVGWAWDWGLAVRVFCCATRRGLQLAGFSPRVCVLVAHGPGAPIAEAWPSLTIPERCEFLRCLAVKKLGRGLRLWEKRTRRRGILEVIAWPLLATMARSRCGSRNQGANY